MTSRLQRAEAEFLARRAEKRFVFIFRVTVMAACLAVIWWVFR